VSFSADYFESLLKCKILIIIKELKDQFTKETNEGFIGNSFVNSTHTKISP
jgi:hypothetical protein